MQKRKKPTFRVQNFGRTSRKRIKSRWRKPRGQDNKQKRKHKNTGARPSAGWRNPPSLRGIHPSGKKEILVHNISTLSGLKGIAIRIGSGVSKRKKDEIRAKAKGMALPVLN